MSQWVYDQPVPHASSIWNYHSKPQTQVETSIRRTNLIFEFDEKSTFEFDVANSITESDNESEIVDVNVPNLDRNSLDTNSENDLENMAIDSDDSSESWTGDCDEFDDSEYVNLFKKIMKHNPHGFMFFAPNVKRH